MQCGVLGFGFNALGQVDTAKPVSVTEPRALGLSAALGNGCRGASEAQLAASWSASALLLSDGCA